MASKREVTMTSGGRTTIPKALRDSLGLLPGDKVTFVEERPGVLIVRPKAGTAQAMRK